MKWQLKARNSKANRIRIKRLGNKLKGWYQLSEYGLIVRIDITTNTSVQCLQDLRIWTLTHARCTTSTGIAMNWVRPTERTVKDGVNTNFQLFTIICKPEGIDEKCTFHRLNGCKIWKVSYWKCQYLILLWVC